MTRSKQAAAIIAAAILGFCLSTLGQAELFDRGGGMIYDTVLDITWLADANAGGSQTWDAANTWAASLNVDGIMGWRLPLASVAAGVGGATDSPVDCSTASEMDCRDNEQGYMFYYNLMGSIFDDLTGDQAPFTNIQFGQWSGTEFASNLINAWDFAFENGRQGYDGEHRVFGAWAVRDGDVDTDQDGINNSVDNCLLAANPLQRDTDSDGIGNFCDPDVAAPNDCTVNFLDLNVYQANFFQAGDLETDNNGDGQTNFLDLNIVKSFIFGPPGPSANGCN